MSQQPHQQHSGQIQGSQQPPLSPPQSASAPLWCHTCSAENRPNASFCTNCGVRLMPTLRPQSLQTQGRKNTPPRSPLSHSKGYHKLSKGERVALIGAIGTIVVAIITYILAPVITNGFTHNPTPAATVNSINTPSPSSPSLNPSAYPPQGWRLAYNDPMKSNSSGYWPEEKDKLGSCQFVDEVYQVSRLLGQGKHYCSPNKFNFTDFVLETQMTIAKGDEGVILFRSTTDTSNNYFFWFSPDGTYGFEIWENYSLSRVLSSGSNTAIHSGLNQSNLIAVVAKGNTFALYANGQLINTVVDKDNSYGSGEILLAAYSASNPTEVLFSNLKVWAPSS